MERLHPGGVARWFAYDDIGRLLRDGDNEYRYDGEGNLVATIPHGVAAAIVEERPRKGFFRWLAETPDDIEREREAELAWRPGMTVCEWGGDGTLRSVRVPSGETVRFEYDALGRRTAKTRDADGTVTRFLWDGNVPLHEWTYPSALRPETTEDKSGVRSFVTPEPRDGMVTWVFDPGTFAPAAKIAGGRAYSIVTDYLGTPIEAYDPEGGRVWARELDIYGRTLRQEGDPGFVPFLYPGQYLDGETGFAYNRFRYYDPSTGNYISSDPVGLAGIIYWGLDFMGVFDTPSVSGPSWYEENPGKQPVDNLRVILPVPYRLENRVSHLHEP